MKCQRCEKPATFHITELAGDELPDELHLCEEHARLYLTPSEEPEEAIANLAGSLAQQLKIGQTAEDLATTALDSPSRVVKLRGSALRD